jgi:hypothetical protein
MAIARPFKRTVRQLADGTYKNGGNGNYVRNSQYAVDGQHYLRGFQVLQKDLLALFDYVEPSDINRPCYSFRTLELLSRICIEIEANCRAILAENEYPGALNHASNLTMQDYRKIELSHRLSGYTIRMPVWQGQSGDRVPFAPWNTPNASLPWYQAYNATKHSRYGNFIEGNFGNLIDAMCGLVAIISAQFLNEDFGPSFLVTDDGPGPGFSYASGGHFLVKFPENWTASDRYEFNWQILQNDANPTQNFTYP